MKSSDIYIVGIGNYSIVIAELAEICGFNVKGFLHYNCERNGEVYLGIPIISSTQEFFKKDITGINFGLSQGNNPLRVEVADLIRSKGGILPRIIHPTVEVARTATVEEGVVLKRNVSIQSATTIKRDSIICDNTTICHHVNMEKGCFVAGSVVIGAYTNVEKFVFIGQSATLPSGKLKNVGIGATIGAGSVVIKDVAAGEIVAGNPARRLN
jgi:sugar O-acyltransferase (sialic acid O-acetyltransferase NeuD family)